MLRCHNSRSLRSRLAGLLLQHFTRVSDALLLIRIRLAQAANVCRDLADELAIDARYGDVRLLVDRDVDTRGHVEHDGVRVAQGENHLFALYFRAITDANDVEIFPETLR